MLEKFHDLDTPFLSAYPNDGAKMHKKLEASVLNVC